MNYWVDFTAAMIKVDSAVNIFCHDEGPVMGNIHIMNYSSYQLVATGRNVYDQKHHFEKVLPGNAGMIKSGDVKRENNMFYNNLMRG